MAYEVISKEDYKNIEKFGLLPTDRDPSAWLRMVARVFAAYKEVSLDRSIVAYINGFWILNNDLIDGNDIKFIIQKGTCFIDDQFIGFTDDILFKYPKVNLIPGNTYWLVLYYKWSYERNFNVAEFQVIRSDLYDPNHMLKVAVFEYTSAGEINLLPQDLDDQYADNFKKLFEIAQEKIIDSLETMKYHYEVFKPGESQYDKFDENIKSGDLVYLDYISGYFRPAAACLKRFDKAVGIYLYNKNNNYKYIIYEGIIDFSDPRWQIDDDRQYLLNLESGTSYYLADACTDSEVIVTEVTNENRGKISTYFFPGTVRVGYALSLTKFFLRIDYTSELNTWNFIEIFGDSERFDKIYKDFFDYYSLQAKIQFLTQGNDELQSIINNLNDLINNITNQISNQNNNVTSDENNVKTTFNDLNSAKDSFNNAISKYNKMITYDIEKNFKSNLISYDLGTFELDKNINFIDNEKNILNNIYTNIDNYFSQNSFSYLKDDSYNALTTAISNIKTSINNLNLYLDEYKTLINGGGIKNIINTTTTLNIDGIRNIISNFISNVSNDNYKTFKTKISNYIIDNTEEKGYLYSLKNKILLEINNINSNLISLNTNHKTLALYKYNNNSYTLPQITYYKYNIGTPNISSCVTSSSGLNKTERIISSQSDNIINTLPTNYETIVSYTLKESLKIKDIVVNLFKSIIYLDSKLKNLINYSDFEISNFDSSANALFNNIQTTFSQYIQKLKDYYDSKVTYFNDKITLDGLNNYKTKENKFLLNFNNNLTDVINKSAQIYTEITSKQSLLSEELEDNIFNRTKSIFALSNYQRIIYNYTYITQRLKIKFSEREKVENDIKIIQNKIYEVQNKIPVDYGLLNKLEQLKAAFQAVYNEINTEIQTLTEEYNKIRTEYLGLDPISDNDPNFDPGSYAIFDLDCLESVE